MGWLSMTRVHMGAHKGPKAYLDAQLSHSGIDAGGVDYSYRVVGSAVVGTTAYYAAVEDIRGGQPATGSAVVCLIHWNPRAANGYVFAYKDMDENMGPCEDDCPAWILILLEPTDNIHALDWRARCAAKRVWTIPKLGERVTFAEPINFTDGYSGRDFTVAKRGRLKVFRSCDNGRLYRIDKVTARAQLPVDEEHQPRALC